MHDLTAMYNKTLELAKEIYADDVDELDNFRSYPRLPKMNDLQVLALSIMTESASIDSENWLFSKLKTNYMADFPFLIDRSRFNRRRRALNPWILEFTKRMSLTMGVESIIDLVDSVPCPIVKNSRERNFSICREDPLTSANKGYSAVDDRYFIGYKLHLLTSEHGIIQDMQVTPASVHDITFLKNLDPEIYTYGKTAIGDKGYISHQVQTDLFTHYDIDLKVPYRRNQKEVTPFDPKLGKKRRRIETQFSQLCDQFRLKLNYAKTFIGFWTRILSKLAAVAVLQRVNVEKGRPLNQIKHAWA